MAVLYQLNQKSILIISIFTSKFMDAYEIITTHNLSMEILINV